MQAFIYAIMPVCASHRASPVNPKDENYSKIVRYLISLEGLSLSQDEDKTRKYKSRLHKTRQVKTIIDKKRQDCTRQDKARQEKTRKIKSS